MRITNYTTFSTEKIREIVRRVRPPGIGGFDITVRNTRRGNRALAYVYGCHLHDRPCPLITIHLNTDTRLPHRWKGGNGYLPSVQFSVEEVLVHLLAHELRHLWQARVPRGHRVWGARGKFSERDADAYAIRMVRAWRRYIPASSGTTRFCAAPVRDAA